MGILSTLRFSIGASGEHSFADGAPLTPDVRRKNVSGHLFRGSSLLSETGEVFRSCNKIGVKTPNFIVAFGDMSSIKWDLAGFKDIPMVAQSIQRLLFD